MNKTWAWKEERDSLSHKLLHDTRLMGNNEKTHTHDMNMYCWPFWHQSSSHLHSPFPLDILLSKELIQGTAFNSTIFTSACNVNGYVVGDLIWIRKNKFTFILYIQGKVVSLAVYDSRLKTYFSFFESKFRFYQRNLSFSCFLQSKSNPLATFILLIEYLFILIYYSWLNSRSNVLQYNP